MGCCNIMEYIQKKAKKQGSKALCIDEVEQDSSKLKSKILLKEKKPLPPCPQPLPLPPFSEQRSRTMKERCGKQPLPQLMNTSRTMKSAIGTSVGSTRYFSYEEIIAAIDNYSSIICASECLNSTMYMASFVGGDGPSCSKILEATVNSLNPSSQDLREFLKEVNILASLEHPNLCKLLGFHASERSESRMLVYERLGHGSLDQLLFVRSNGPPIDWNTRIKIATSAAQGLTFLHEEGPLQAMYCDFSVVNIQVDEYFSAKLSGYGFVGDIPKEESVSNSAAARYIPKETLKRGVLTPKSNVWSFGIFLLELLTGRKHFDSYLPREENRNLIKWCQPFLATNTGLTHIIDPRLKGRFPLKAARRVAEIAEKCLQREAPRRPTMRTIVDNLTSIKQELPTSTSVGGRLRFSPLLSNVAITSTLPTRLPLPPHPHHTSSSNFNIGEINRD